MAALPGVAQDPQSSRQSASASGAGGVGQRLMQAATEVFPGWIRIRRPGGVTRGRHVRRLHPEGGADAGNLLPAGATLCARVCGATLARATPTRGNGIVVPSVPSHLGDPRKP